MSSLTLLLILSLEEVEHNDQSQRGLPWNVHTNRAFSE